VSASPDPTPTDQSALRPVADETMRPVDMALEQLGLAIARLEAALSEREQDRAARDGTAAAAAETAARQDADLDALRQEYTRLHGEYEQLRTVVGQADGRLEGTVARLRALLEG